MHRDFFPIMLMQEVTPIVVPMAVRIALYFTKSQEVFQKRKELSQK